MQLTFYKQDSFKSYTIELTAHYEKIEPHIYMKNEEGEGGQFNAMDVFNVVYDALDKYFKENH
jgi:hypothetical protein